jgi:hypothetical protein
MRFRQRLQLVRCESVLRCAVLCSAVTCCAVTRCPAGKYKVSNGCAFTWPKGQYGMCGDQAGQSRWMQPTPPKTYKAGDTIKLQVSLKIRGGGGGVSVMGQSHGQIHAPLNAALLCLCCGGRSRHLAKSARRKSVRVGPGGRVMCDSTKGEPGWHGDRLICPAGCSPQLRSPVRFCSRV